MTGQQGVQERALGVWGAQAYEWSGEERPRVAGFPVDPSGRQRVLGFPADPFRAAGPGWFRRHTLGRKRAEGGRARIVVAVVAILDSGEEKQHRARGRRPRRPGPS